MNIDRQQKIMTIATPYMRMVLGEYKGFVVKTLNAFIEDRTIILDDWKWVVSDGGHLCVTIDCKIRTLFQNATFYTDVTIVMFPTYPDDIPQIYLKKKPNCVVNLRCPYIRDKCIIKYNTRRKSGWDLKEAILECERLFASCCPVFTSLGLSEPVENVQETNDTVVSAIQFSDLTLDKFIGSGAFGNVYKGTYKGIPVAIKELKSLEEHHLKNIRHEISTQCQINNQYIIKVYGCCFNEENSLFIVMELADCSLTTYLRKERQNLTDFQKGKICYDVSLGLYELYKRHIIHRDIKLDNILCVGNTVKISDFGFAKLVPDSDSMAVSYSGTPSTMAPEFFTGESVGIKADVYSFGCVMEEIYSGVQLHSDQRFRGKTDLQRAFISRHYRPTIHSSVPPEVQKIITACFRDQDSRPTIDIVARELYNYLIGIINENKH